MKAVFNVMPYKFWNHGIEDGTYLMVTDSDGYADEFAKENECSYVMPPYECGDGLVGDRYSRRIVDWHMNGGEVVIRLTGESFDEDCAHEFADFIEDFHGDDLSSVVWDGTYMTIRPRRDMHPHDLFDLLYDIFDSEVEETHYEGEAA